MRKFILCLLVVLLPIFVFAKEYKSNDINIKLNVNDESYIVLTRDNLSDNPDLVTLNITEEKYEEEMKKDNIYFDIIKRDISYEVIIVVPNTITEFNNLKDLDNTKLEDIKKEITSKIGTDKVSTYKNKYDYLVFEYVYQDTGIYIINYYTVINSRGYNIQLQKKTSITEEERNGLKEIVDSIDYKVIEEKKEEIKEEKEKFNYMNLVYGAILGLMAGVITYYIGITIKRLKQGR